MIHTSCGLLSVLVAGKLGRLHLGRTKLRLSTLSGQHCSENFVHHLECRDPSRRLPCVPLTASLVDRSRGPTSRAVHRAELLKGQSLDKICLYGSDENRLRRTPPDRPSLLNGLHQVYKKNDPASSSSFSDLASLSLVGSNVNQHRSLVSEGKRIIPDSHRPSNRVQPPTVLSLHMSHHLLLQSPPMSTSLSLITLPPEILLELASLLHDDYVSCCEMGTPHPLISLGL